MFHVLVICSFLLLSVIPLHEYNMVCLFMYHLKEIRLFQVFSKYEEKCYKQLHTGFYVNMFSFVLNRYLEGLLSHMVDACLIS